MLGWLEKIKGSRKPSLPEGWLWVDFVIGPEPPPIPSSRVTGVETSVLPADLLPGFSAVGRFGPRSHSYEGLFTPGKLTLGLGDSPEARLFPQYPAFEMICCPTPAQGEASNGLWALVGERIESLYVEALFARLFEPTGSDSACYAAAEYLFQLKMQAQRDRAQQAMLDFLESAPIFSPLGHPVDGPKRWTIDELLAADAVFPVPELKGFEIQERERLPGIAVFSEGELYSRLSEFYALARDTQLERKALQMLTAELTSKREQQRALEAGFGETSRTSSGWRVPVYGHPPLELDLKARTVLGPVEGTKEKIELSLDQLKRVVVDRREVDGDTKTHEYFTLLMSDGRQTLIFQERYKHYYEGGSVQAEIDRYQDKAKSCLHAFADALGYPNTRFASRRLLGKSLEQLT